jgi:hypothetical protein
MLCGIAFVAMGICSCGEVEVEDSDSATEGCEFFECTETTACSGGSGTTVGSETDGDVNPVDFCVLQTPDDPFEPLYFEYVCAGETRVNFAFDFYGKSGIANIIASEIVCVDISNVKNVDPGYVFTCFGTTGTFPFGPEVEDPNGVKIDACCLRESPETAVDGFCTIDGAEELCEAASDQLNDLRSKIPPVPFCAVISGACEAKSQLTALNEFIAQSSSQTECSQEIAMEILNDEVANWGPMDDPEWSWFRDVRTAVPEFTIDDSEKSGAICFAPFSGEPLNGEVTGGSLLIESALFGNSAAAVEGGKFTFENSDCELNTCDFEFQTFSVDIGDFKVGPVTFRDVHVSLDEPAMGQISDTKVGFSSNEMQFTAVFRLDWNGSPLFGGSQLFAALSNTGIATARLTSDPLFGVHNIDAIVSPLTFHLSTELAPCE